ncbi:MULTISPECIES: SH3 domain-containing protein [Streptomyces]|uniref:SH3 domain-containing protein n=1 Tax=Streptomyces TaxID=1883 RepID=UPI000ABADFA3
MTPLTSRGQARAERRHPSPRLRASAPAGPADVRRRGRATRAGLLTAALAALLATAAAPTATAAPDTSPSPPAVAQAEVPAGVTAGVAVFDRQTGTFTEQVNSAGQFRSASVVKLLLALDVLWGRTPESLPAADRTRIDTMLRSSNDAAAGTIWANNGQGAIIDRMVARLGLTDTARPPATHPGYWGYTAMSARDTVRIYRYLLDSAPAPVRDYVLGNLRQSTRCASDGYDQHFGIAGSFNRPWAVKQGWSGFTSGGCTSAATTATAAAPTAKAAGTAAPTAKAATAAAAVDLSRPALHTTGLVGPGDRAIVAVLTLHPTGTTYGKAYTDVGRLTRSLNVPGATRPAGTWIGTWGSGVRVRAQASTDSAAITTLPAGVEVLVGCQKRGQQVSVPPYVNDWWAHLPQLGGYMTNIYLSSPDNQVPGVPVC